jgi:hypothetical protein
VTGQHKGQQEFWIDQERVYLQVGDA